ncbi:MAG TPA: hypothetical protein VH092_31680, partial [Urbifossiella sp.]|nr:hypothetical protein [Urbifossiella sp.]
MAPPFRVLPRPHLTRTRRVRVLLALEELEGREVLSPVVSTPFYPTPPQTPEGTSIAFSGGPSSGGGSFAAFDLADIGQTYTADLIATHGTISVDTGMAGEFGVAVANNGTPDVTLTADLAVINNFITNSGYTYTPAPYYSGDATLALSVPDPAGISNGYGQYTVQVLPVAQQPAFDLNIPGPGFFGPGPITFPPGTVTVIPWADTDGSETESVVLSVSGGNVDPTQFTLTAGGTVVPLDSDNLWTVSAPTPTALQTMLDSLVLTPPAGFSGTIDLDVFIVADDTANYPSTGTQQTDEQVGNEWEAPIRYFAGGAAVTAAPLATAENQTLDLGGLLAVTDPDDEPGDTHTVTLAAPAGTFSFDPSTGSFAATVTGAGTNTLTVSGTLADITQVLDTPGALGYDAASYFSGEVPLTVTFDHQRPNTYADDGSTVGYPASTGLDTLIRVSPVASFPSAFPRFEMPPVVPVGPGPSAVPAGLFQIFSVPDTDGSEALSVIVNVTGGPTPGFVLTAAGTTVPRQADGSWVLTDTTAAGLQNQLDTLTLTPAGGLTGFGYSLQFTVQDTDTASYPSDGTTATDVSTDELPEIPLRLF